MSEITQDNVDILASRLKIDAKMERMVAAFVAQAIQFAATHPDFAKQYGTYGVECLIQAFESPLAK